MAKKGKKSKSSPPLKASPAKQRSQQSSTDSTTKKVKPTRAATEVEIAPQLAMADARFWQWATILFLIGIVLRQWALGSFPFSPDEAEHAWFTQGFATYHYDPIYHGPLLYHLEAIVFALLGQSDYTARLMPSLLGIATLALVMGPARRWLGERGSLWALGLLAISPVMVTYQRRIIHDSQVMFLTLGAVLCFLATLEEPSTSQPGRRARLGVTAFLTLLMATKANALFIIVMLLGFWVAERAPLRLPILARPGWPLFAFLAGGFASYLGLREPDLITQKTMFQSAWMKQHGSFNDWSYSFTLKLLELLRGQKLYYVICLLLLVGFWLWLMSRMRTRSVDGEVERPGGLAGFGMWLVLGPQPLRSGIPTNDDNERVWDFKTPLLCLVVIFVLFTLFYGMWWRIPGYMLTSAWAKVSGHYMATAPGPHDPGRMLAQSWEESRMALPKMWSYWAGQQGKPRLPGPHDYYIVLMLLYELPIVVAAIGGIVHAARRRTPFTDLLLWWAFTSFLIYAIANEKVPWLLTHIMLPLTLLAGWWLGQLEIKRSKLPAFALVCLAGVVFLMRGVLATNFEPGANRHEPMFYAQTTEAYRDTLFEGLRDTARLPDPMWVDGERQWPTVWYISAGSPHLAGGSESYIWQPGPNIRLAVADVAKWVAASRRYPGWTAKQCEFFIWPRASWKALRPDWYWGWWWDRSTSRAGGNSNEPEKDNFLSEAFTNEVIIAHK